MNARICALPRCKHATRFSHHCGAEENTERAEGARVLREDPAAVAQGALRRSFIAPWIVKSFVMAQIRAAFEPLAASWEARSFGATIWNGQQGFEEEGRDNIVITHVWLPETRPGGTSKGNGGSSGGGGSGGGGVCARRAASFLACLLPSQRRFAALCFAGIPRKGKQKQLKGKRKKKKGKRQKGRKQQQNAGSKDEEQGGGRLCHTLSSAVLLSRGQRRGLSSPPRPGRRTVWAPSGRREDSGPPEADSTLSTASTLVEPNNNATSLYRLITVNFYP